MASERFKLADHQGESLTVCSAGLRRIDAYNLSVPKPGSVGTLQPFEVMTKQETLRKIEDAFSADAYRLGKFELPPALRRFMEMRRKCFGL